MELSSLYYKLALLHAHGDLVLLTKGVLHPCYNVVHMYMYMYQPTRPLPPPRRSHAAVTECTIGDGEQCDYEESQSVILEPLQLTANITRNITLPTKAFPNVDISLSLEAIKVLE